MKLLVTLSVALCLCLPISCIPSREKVKKGAIKSLKIDCVKAREQAKKRNHKFNCPPFSP